MALHCPATLLVAGHGEAGSARALAQALAGEHLSEVISSTDPQARESAEAIAADLDLPVGVVVGLEEISAGEDEQAVLARYRDALEGLSDTHRGLTVLVLSHPEVMSRALLALADTVPAGARTASVLPAAVPARVEVDGDGVRILSWPGSRP